MKKQIVSLLFVVMFNGTAVMAETNDAKAAGRELENLTLDQALELAESLQPELAEAKAMVEAAEAQARQAGAFPNPEGIVGVQQQPFSGNDASEKEYLAGVGQVIPLGRRLAKAREADLLERDVRLRELDVKRQSIRKRVHGAFATALYQEKAFHLQSGIMQNIEKAVATIRARLEAGDALLEDTARMEMELARTKTELKRAESMRGQSLIALASAIGDATLSVKSLTGTLDATFEIPALETLAAHLSSQPESAQVEADIRMLKSRVDVAKAERIPDVRAELLYHRLEAGKVNTLDVGLSIPLPLFNRNKGNISKALAEVAAGEARSRMTQNELTTRLRETYLQLATALANNATFKSEIISKADTVLKGAEARYAAGDVSLTEVLSVRRDWAAVQLGYLESLRDVMQAWAELLPYVVAGKSG